MRGKVIALYNDRRPRLAIVPSHRDRYDVTASHRNPTRRPPRSISAHPVHHAGSKLRLAGPRVAVPVLSLRPARRAATRACSAGVVAHALPSFAPLVTPSLFSTAQYLV